MLVIAVIGIGHGLTFPSRNMIEQQGQLRFRAVRLQPSKVAEVRGIERHNMVESVEIGTLYLARSQPVDVDTVSLRRCPGAWVGRLPDMPVAGAGAVHLEVEPEALGFDPERGFGQWRPTDIAQADEKDSSSHRRSLVAK